MKAVKEMAGVIQHEKNMETKGAIKGIKQIVQENKPETHPDWEALKKESERKDKVSLSK